MPSLTEERPHRPVARRNRHDHSFLAFPVQSVPAQGITTGNQGNMPPSADNFTLENMEIQLANIHGAMLSIGSAVTDASNRLRTTDTRTRETMYRNSFTFEERRNLSGTLEFVKEDVAAMADRLNMALSGIRAVSTRLRLLERNAQNTAAVGASQEQPGQIQGRRRHNGGNGRVEQVAMRFRQIRLTPVNFGERGEN